MKHIIETEHWSGLCSKKKIASAKGLHLTLVNWVFNAFFSFTTIVSNVLTIQALRKTPSLPKTLKTLLLSLAVSDLGVGLLVQPLYVALLVMNIQQNTESIAYVTVYKGFLIQKKISVLASHFGVISLTVLQNLGNPSSSQIPGSCASQACCCQLCSTLDSSLITPVIVVVCVISTGLLYCKVDAAVRHHTAGTSSTEWRYGKRCKGQKIYTCYILRLCGVFSLLIANILCCFCHDRWWNCLVILFMVFQINSCVSQFIPQSLIYCWKMRHIRQLSNRKRIEGRSESLNAHLTPAAVSSMDTDGAVASGLHRLHYFRFELFLCKHR